MNPLTMPASRSAERIWGLEAPTMTTAAANLVEGASGTVTVPVPAILIQHEQGLVLFDTGFAPLLNDDPHAYFGDLAELLQIRTHPGQRLDRQLAALGFRLEDVTHVVLSHGHSDHSGGLHLFPDARFFAGEGEFEWARDPSPQSLKYFRWAEELEPVQHFDWTTVVDPVHDLFSDGALLILRTPGHTPGELSMLVRLPGRTVVLTGDTVHLRVGLETMAPGPNDWDKARAVESLRHLRELERAGAELWIAHDPADWARMTGVGAEQDPEPARRPVVPGLPAAAGEAGPACRDHPEVPGLCHAPARDRALMVALHRGDDAAATRAATDRARSLEQEAERRVADGVGDD